MTQLPKPTQAAEARAQARQCLEQLKDKHLPGTGLPILHQDAGEIFARRVLQLKALSGALGMLCVIEFARAGWDEADLALRELAMELMHRKQCPPMLEAYAMEALKTPYRRKRGRRKSTNLVQDVMLTALMADLVRKFSLHPTRKTDAHRDSACDILVVAVKQAKWLKRSFDYKDAERLWGLWGLWVQEPAQAPRPSARAPDWSQHARMAGGGGRRVARQPTDWAEARQATEAEASSRSPAQGRKRKGGGMSACPQWCGPRIGGDQMRGPEIVRRWKRPDF
jgi:hypothetical protein